MPYFTCDTSVLISRKLADFHKTPESFLMSAVVLMELMSGANDDSDRKLYEQAFHRYQKNNSLIVPTYDDWLTSYKILYFLTHARKRTQKGRLRPLPPGAAQRLALDVLIAVSARRWKAQVVTENWSDFKAIQRYCKTTVVRAVTFFKK
jgi:predicted nucleic acid-binding protein